MGTGKGVICTLALLSSCWLGVTAAHAKALDVSDLTPYLDRGPGRQARAALRAGRYEEAEKLLRRQVAGYRRDRQQARFLLAYALLKQGKWQEAAERFARLTRQYPLLKDYERFYGATALFRLGNFASAAQLAGRIPNDSAVALDAQLLRAEALHASGKIEQSEQLWRNYLAEQGKGSRRAEAHYYVGLALTARAERAQGAAATDLRRRAIAQFKQVVVQTPLSSWKEKAQARLATLAPQVPGGSDLVTLTPEDLFTQSLAFYQSMRNVTAERGFERAMAAGLPPELHCRACYYRGHAAYRQRERARAADLFAPCIDICKRAGDTMLTVKCLYNRARGLRHKKAYKEAIATFEQLEREYPNHSYADDARLLSAEILAQLERKEQVEQKLASLPKDYPAGDMSREAIWRLARESYLDGKFSKALRYLDQSLALGRARHYYAAGRALYWKGRIFERRGKTEMARRLYEQTVRDYPVSYYALLALNRLRERHRSSYRKIERELIRPVGSHAGRWVIEEDRLTQSPQFRRGVELARLGFSASAAREFARAGLSVKEARRNEQLWIAAAVYDRAQLWQLSHSVPRYRDRRYQQRYPLRDNFRRWRLAYPLAFESFVRRHSSKARISPYLTLAIMREESAFDADIESYANAIGLMQLILPTARAAGEFHRIAVTRERLKDPATNIQLGTTYLAFLRRSFGNIDALAIAGYNAGHGAVFRWLKQFGGNSLDEFIERIPYDQTRRYTKRVLSSLFAYQLLYERQTAKRVPRFGQRLPRLVRRPVFEVKRPKKRRRRR